MKVISSFSRSQKLAFNFRNIGYVSSVFARFSLGACDPQEAMEESFVKRVKKH